VFPNSKVLISVTLGGGVGLALYIIELAVGLTLLEKVFFILLLDRGLRPFWETLPFYIPLLLRDLASLELVLYIPLLPDSVEVLLLKSLLVFRRKFEGPPYD